MGNRFVKQSSEIFPIWGSLYKVLSTGETITLATSTVTARDKGNRSVTSTVLSAGSKTLANDPRGGTNNALQIDVQGSSEALSPYTITFNIITSSLRRYEIDAKMVVKDATFVVSTTTTSSTTTTTSP
jgi:hypothetical protein